MIIETNESIKEASRVDIEEGGREGGRGQFVFGSLLVVVDYVTIVWFQRCFWRQSNAMRNSALCCGPSDARRPRRLLIHAIVIFVPNWSGRLIFSLSLSSRSYFSRPPPTLLDCLLLFIACLLKGRIGDKNVKGGGDKRDANGPFLIRIIELNWNHLPGFYRLSVDIVSTNGNKWSNMMFDCKK